MADPTNPSMPAWTPPPVDPNMALITNPRVLPSPTRNIAPLAFGGATPPTPLAPADVRWNAAQRQADANLVGAAPNRPYLPDPQAAMAVPPRAAPTVAAAPAAAPASPALPYNPVTASAAADAAATAHFQAAQGAANASIRNFFTPSPAAAAQAASDRQAIMGVAGDAGNSLKGFGAAALDVATLPSRAAMGIVNTALRVPNAFGAGIPYIPENAFGGSSSSMTPYYDKYVRANQPADPSVPAAPATATASASSSQPAAQTASQDINPYNITPVGKFSGDASTVAGWKTYTPPAATAAAAAPAATGRASGGVGGVAGGSSAAGAPAMDGGDPNLPALWTPAHQVGAATRFGQPAQASSGNAFLDGALSYIQGGGNMFEQASRARQMAALIGGYSQMHSANANAGAMMYSADQRLAGDRLMDLGATTREGMSLGEKQSEFQATPVDTGARPNPLGPFYPNLPEKGLPRVGGMPVPVGATGERAQQRASVVDGTHHTYQGVDYVMRNGQWTPAQ